MKLKIMFSKRPDGDIAWSIAVEDSADFPTTAIFLESPDPCTVDLVSLEKGTLNKSCGCSPDTFEAKLDVNNVAKVISAQLREWRDIEVPESFELIL
jgi:hypothetical protein